MVEVTPPIQLQDQALLDEQQQRTAATPAIFGPIAAKGKKSAAQKPDIDPMNPTSYGDMGPMGRFFVNMLLMLTQFLDPDNKSNNGLIGMISKAFGFEDDAGHSQFRELHDDIEKRGRNTVRDSHKFRLDATAARGAISEGASIIAKNAPTNPTERQARVMAVLPDAAKSAGVSSDLAVGLWGYESSFGKNLRSGTGCEGDFQFTRVTLAEVISKKGTTISADLKQKAQEFSASSDPAKRSLAADLQKQAAVVQTMHEQTKGMSGDQLKSFASKNKGTIDALRNAPETSAFAATQYIKTVADQMKLDSRNSKDFGLIYAGYNIGVGNALDIKNGKAAKGWEIDANAGVAAKGSAAAQRASYDQAIASRLASAEGRNFAALAKGGGPSGSKTAYTEASRSGTTLSETPHIKTSLNANAATSSPDTAGETPALRPRPVVALVAAPSLS